MGAWGFATAVGLSVLGFGGHALGAAGALRPVPVAILAIGLALPGSPIALRQIAGMRPPAGAGWGAAAVVAFGAALALYPPMPFDETLYHLPMARAFARAGALPLLPDLRFPAFPALFEVLSAEVMLFDGDIAPHLLSLLAVCATAAVLIDWGRRRGSPAAGQWAAALYAGSPLVAYLAGTAYVEPLLALFTTASLSALDAWRETRDGATAAAAALLAGAAAATKYLGLVPAIIAGAVLLSTAATRPALRRQAALGLAVLAAALALSYGRAAWHTGNPLHPYFTRVFGENPWSFTPYEAPSEGHLIGWLRAPFDAVFARDRVGEQPPISPGYLLAVPFIALFGARRSRCVLAAVALYAVALPVHIRYLIPAAPLLALAASLDVARWHGTAWLARDPWRRLVIALLLTPSLAWAAYHAARLGPPPASAELRDAFLSARVPGRAALAFLNREHGDGYTVYGAHAEHLRYYARGRFLGDLAGLDSFARVLGGQTPEETHRRLRASGAGFLLVPATDAGRDLDRVARASPLFRPVFRDAGAAVYALAPPPP